MPVIRREIRFEDIGFVNQAFDRYDSDQKGYLTFNEFKLAAIVIYGRKLLKEEKARLRNQADLCVGKSPDTTAFTRSRFMDVMLTYIATTRPEEDSRAMFNALDKTGRGYLLAEDLKSALQQYAPHLSLANRIASGAFTALDADGDGRVTFRDFEFIAACNLDR